jgi:two-component system, response regulator PdtaR
MFHRLAECRMPLWVISDAPESFDRLYERHAWKGIMMEKLLRILIVEDDASITSLLVETVNGLGHIVCAVAATEEDAVEYAQDRQPDLMIVDAGLAEGNGISAMRTILAYQHTPHFFVTGNPRGVRAFFPDATILQKPFFVPELAAAIERTVSGPPRS